MLSIRDGGIKITQLGSVPLVASMAPNRKQSVLLLATHLVVITTVGGVKEIKLPASVAVPDFLSHYSVVLWSPDSTRVALTLRRTGENRSSTQLMATVFDLRTNIVTVVAGGYAAGWSSDGRGLLLLRRAALPAPCNPQQMACPTSDLLVWRDGKSRVLVTARELLAQGEGNSWPIAWDVRTDKIFLSSVTDYDTELLTARSAEDGRELWRIPGDFATLVGPGVFGLAQRGYDSLHESTTYAPILVNEEGAILRRYAAKDAALHTAEPAWSPGLKRIARKRDLDTTRGPVSGIVVSGPQSSWDWRPPGQGTSVCGYYWGSPDSLVAWTQPRRVNGNVLTEAWWLNARTRSTSRLLRLRARAEAEPDNWHSVCPEPAHDGQVLPITFGWE